MKEEHEEDAIKLQEQSTPEPTDAGNKTRKRIRQVAILIGIILAGWIVISVISIFVTPDKQIQQIYLIPKDAVFIVQSSEPVKDWKKFSESEPWSLLKQSKSLAELTEQVQHLDSIIQSNKTLLSLVGKRDLLISIHKTRPADWDMLMVLDLQKTSKLNLLKDQIEHLAKLGGFKVTHRSYKGLNIIEMRDPDTRDILYVSFVENHVVASYTSGLVEAAIDEREHPVIGLNPDFIEVEKMVAGKGLFRLFVNYAYLPQFMHIYLGESNEFINLFSNSMEFAGLSFTIDKEKIETKGYTLKKEKADPYMVAWLNSGTHKMKAHEIMSGRTAFYTNIGFENPAGFIKELETILSSGDQEMYKNYEASRKKIENLFDISLEKNFVSWMAGEFAISQSEPGLLGQEPELILAVRAKSIKEAKKNMEFIEKKINSRTPIKIKTVHYKKYEVNYIEMKGFFRLFFGKLFDKFEKPYYTYIEDYVVFSNKSSSLLSFIEDYEQKNVLKNNPGFKKSLARFNSSSNLFIYMDMPKFYPQLQQMLNPSTWQEVKSNREVLYSFPAWTMQLNGEKNRISLQYIMDYKPYIEEPVLADSGSIDTEDKVLNEEATTEKELMNELKRFYVEKFQGNILREFYPEGALQSESEVKDGKRHGRYREYYENGQLKARGKYRNNQPKGTWKYYTQEGKFDRKQKF